MQLGPRRRKCPAETSRDDAGSARPATLGREKGKRVWGTTPILQCPDSATHWLNLTRSKADQGNVVCSKGLRDLRANMQTSDTEAKYV